MCEIGATVQLIPINGYISGKIALHIVVQSWCKGAIRR